MARARRAARRRGRRLGYARVAMWDGVDDERVRWPADPAVCGEGCSLQIISSRPALLFYIGSFPFGPNDTFITANGRAVHLSTVRLAPCTVTSAIK